MTSLYGVRQAVKERLKSVGDIAEFYWQMPDYIETPAVVVAPDYPTADPEQAFWSSSAIWNLMVTLVVDWVDEDAAQEQLSRWLDTAGPLISALLAEDVDDALGHMTRDVRVTSIGEFNTMKMRGTMYYYAQIRVKVRA